MALAVSALELGLETETVGVFRSEEGRVEGFRGCVDFWMVRWERGTLLWY